MNEVDSDFIINLKLTNAGVQLYELNAGNNKDIYQAYMDSGGMKMKSPLDTHYVICGAYVMFIGNKRELLEFVNSTYENK